MTEQQLKIELQQINKNHGKIDGTSMSYNDYALEMLKFIGVKDAQLRDDLIYTIFDQWIEAGRFTKEQLETYIKICLDDDHLMYGIVDQREDTVYTRTFSALFIASILYEHNERPCLNKEMVTEVKKRFMEYYLLERDLRGYIIEGGWAHAAAHGADVIKELARCKEFNKQDMLDLLKGLQQKISQGKYVYIDREPERFCVGVRNIFYRKFLTEEEIFEWIDSFHKEQLSGEYMDEWHTKINVQNFFKTLYFALKKEGFSERIVRKVEQHIAVL